ncbi:MAG: hypothetical protein RSC01_07935, partial [Oscillospiraceae bacterium]
SRAAAPTEWGEYGKIAKSHGDCEIQLHCKTLTGVAEPPPVRVWSVIILQKSGINPYLGTLRNSVHWAK